MNNFKIYFDQHKNDLESFASVRNELIQNKSLKWEDYYWATKYLYEYDQEGKSDSIIIDYLENAFVSGLNIYSNRELFLDASRILARMYFKYKAYRKAENCLILLRDLAIEDLPEWVFFYSATTSYKIDMAYSMCEPKHFFSYLQKVDIENEKSRHQYISIIKDYLNNAAKYVVKNSKTINIDIDFERIIESIRPYMDEVAEEWNNLLVSAQSANSLGNTEKINVPNAFSLLSLLLQTQALKISSLEDKIDMLQQQITYSTNKEALNQSNEEELTDIESSIANPEIPQGLTKDYVVTGRKPRYLVFGVSQISVDHMRGIAKTIGLDKDQIEFMLDYDQNKRFNFDNLRYNSPYGGILIGPNAHKMVSIDEYSSIIQKLTNEDGFPPVEEIRTTSGELKITKASFKDALKRIITHVDSIAFNIKS